MARNSSTGRPSAAWPRGTRHCHEAGARMPMIPARWLPPLALAVLTMLWGYSWVIAKQALAYAPPFALAAERSLLGALALLAMVRLMGKPFRLVAPRETLLIGLSQLAGFMAFSTWALVEGGAGKT